MTTDHFSTHLSQSLCTRPEGFCQFVRDSVAARGGGGGGRLYPLILWPTGSPHRTAARSSENGPHYESAVREVVLPIAELIRERERGMVGDQEMGRWEKYFTWSSSNHGPKRSTPSSKSAARGECFIHISTVLRR